MVCAFEAVLAGLSDPAAPAMFSVSVAREVSGAVNSNVVTNNTNDRIIALLFTLSFYFLLLKKKLPCREWWVVRGGLKNVFCFESASCSVY